MNQTNMKTNEHNKSENQSQNEQDCLVDKVPADCDGRITTPVLQHLNDNLTNFHLWQAEQCMSVSYNRNKSMPSSLATSTMC